MQILATLSRALPPGNPPRSERNRSGGDAALVLMMALVFAPVAVLHALCLAQPAVEARHLVAPAAEPAGGPARGARVAAPARG